MKNLKNDLFKELELSNTNSENVIGGSYTSAQHDTTMNGGTGYDIVYDSMDSNGNVFDVSSVVTRKLSDQAR